jgi:adenine-specific DNA glycosylase
MYTLCQEEEDDEEEEEKEKEEEDGHGKKKKKTALVTELACLLPKKSGNSIAKKNVAGTGMILCAKQSPRCRNGSISNFCL